MIRSPRAPVAPEKAIQASIIRTLRDLGGAVWNLSQPRASKQTPGLPDLIVAYRGRFACVEVKRPGGKLRPAQAEFQEIVGGCGIECLVWTSTADAVRWASGRAP